MKLNEIVDHKEEYRQYLITRVKNNLPHLLQVLDFNINMFSKYNNPRDQERLAAMKDSREELLQIAQGNVPPNGPSSEVMNMLYGLSMTDRDTYGT